MTMATPPRPTQAAPVLTLGHDPRRLEMEARRLEALGALELEKCRRHLVYYLERYSWTVDEHEREEPNRKLIHGDPWIDSRTLQPIRELDGGEDDYLRLTAAVWFQEPLMLVPKSRQLRLTHLMVASHRWLAQFHVGQRVLLQSKKFEDADALLSRAVDAMELERRLYPHMPWPTYRRKEGRIIFDHGSVMMAAAQGADVVRSYTFSAIMSDEMAFQTEAEAAYTAAIPTVEGGGKFTGISSANPGFFENLVFDVNRDF